MEHVTAAWLKRRLDEAHPPVVLDVRTLAEYKAGHIAGAVSLPLSLLPLRLGELHRRQAHVVVCNSGVRSYHAGRFLDERGYSVFNLEGGLQSWPEPLVRS